MPARGRLAVACLAVLTVASMPLSPARHAVAAGESVSTEMRYGPFLVPPGLGEPRSTPLAVPDLPMPCQDCFITGARVDVVYADGTPANLDTGVMLHHFIAFNGDERDSTCAPDTPYGERFLLAGNERTDWRLPPGFGYRYGSGSVFLNAELMNHSAEPKLVFLAVRYAHEPGNAELQPTRPVWMDQNNCRSSKYGVPAGESRRTTRWTSTVTGRVVSAGGHLHDGGLRNVLGNDTTGEEICVSYAGYGTDPVYMGSLESISGCRHDRLGTVRAGDVLTLDSYYDSPVPQDDVMAVMLAYVFETDDLDSGTPAPPQPRPDNNNPPDRLPGHGHH